MFGSMPGAKRIMILNLIPNTIGDTLFLIPMIRAIKRKFKNTHLSVTISPPLKPLLKKVKEIDELVAIPRLEKLGNKASKLKKGLNYIAVFLDTLRLLRKGRYDVVLMTQPNFWPNQILPWLSGIRKRIGYDYPGAYAKFLLTDQVRFMSGFEHPERHYVESLFDLLAPLGIKGDKEDKKIDLHVSKEELNEARRALERFGVKGKFVCFQAGAKWKRKQWPADLFQSLAKKIVGMGYEVLLLGSAEEFQMNEDIRDANTKIINLCGKLKLDALAGVLSMAELLIGNDSGLAHLASAVGTTTITIYGTTSIAHSRPLGTGKTIAVFNRAMGEPKRLFEREDLEAHRAIASITVSDVFRAAKGCLKLDGR